MDIILNGKGGQNMLIKIDREKCTDCGLCLETCPINIMERKGGLITIDESRCIKCKTCVAICPVKAIYIV